MKKSNKPRFSVVIPCYNEADFIGATLDSIKSQTFKGKTEIIVVDNNCTDATVNIARKYGAKIVKESNPGVCWARQAGTSAASGEIVISTDADTVYSRNWLSTINNAFEKNNQLVAVGGPCTYITGPLWGRSFTHFLFGAVYLMQHIIGHPFYMSATNIAFKKSAWNGYNVNLPQAGDELDLLHDLRKRGKVRFIFRNSTYTSGRRLEQGFVYNVFVTFLYYYMAAYYINRLFGREIIGSAPAFRKKATKLNLKTAFSSKYTSVFLVLFLTVLVLPFSHGFVKDNYHDTISTIDRVKTEFRN